MDNYVGVVLDGRYGKSRIAIWYDTLVAFTAAVMGLLIRVGRDCETRLIESSNVEYRLLFYHRLV